jgi:hypothetical protein
MGFLVKCTPKQQRYVDGEVAPVLYVGVQELQDSTPESKRHELTATLDFEQARQITFESEERAARAVQALPPMTHVDFYVIEVVDAQPICQRTEVAGAPALATDHHCSPLRDPIPLPAPDVFKKAARVKNETPVAEISRQVALSLVKEPSLSTRTASNFKRASRVTTAYAGPVVVLLIMLAFLFSQLGIRRPALTAVTADKIAVDSWRTRDDVGHAESPLGTGSENPRNGLPALEPALPEPSHLRVTDPAASSLLEGLSLYEMQTVRHQAEYGDDVAALTLGMAYEIGRHVPRSCTQAAHWVAVAAEEGNSAAQYNLALRYVSGDGMPTNLDEARKWLEKASGRGYQKARLALQASHL